MARWHFVISVVNGGLWKKNTLYNRFCNHSLAFPPEEYKEYYLIFLGSPQYDISETISSAQMECVKGKMEVSDSQRPC